MKNRNLPVDYWMNSCLWTIRKREAGLREARTWESRRPGGTGALDQEKRMGTGAGRWKRKKSLLQSFSPHPLPQPWLPLSASTWTQTSRQPSPWTVLGLDTVWSSMPTPGEDWVVTGFWLSLTSLPAQSPVPLLFFIRKSISLFDMAIS